MLLPLSEEEQLYCDAVEGTVKRVSPVEHVQKMDNQKQFDFGLHKALAELGVWGVGVEEEFGGAGGTPKLQVLTLEALGRLATSMAVFGVVQVDLQGDHLVDHVAGFVIHRCAPVTFPRAPQ